MDLADVAARDFEGILRALRVEHRVAEDGEEPVGEDAHGRFVLDEQDGLSALRARDRERGTGGLELLDDARQVELERRASLRLALGPDVPAALLDDPVDGGEAQPGTGLLRREERLEEMRPD